MNGLVFDIEKFAVHDGPGIRTVIFLKGCPLHCLWCHNPESQSFQPEIMFAAQNCTRCGNCVQICPNECHSIKNGVRTYDRSACTRCGECIKKCYPAALKFAGWEMTADEVMAEVAQDKIFFQNSGGGITLSGGEPLSQPEFAAALLRSAKTQGIHTAVETSGFAPEQVIDDLIDLVDLWLWDIKALPEQYPALTGGDWATIERNLKKVATAGAAIHLRCPMIPGLNDSDENLAFIASVANSTPGVERIDPEPYHTLGESKNCHLGRTQYFSTQPYEKEKIEQIKESLRARTGRIPVSG